MPNGPGQDRCGPGSRATRHRSARNPTAATVSTREIAESNDLSQATGRHVSGFRKESADATRVMDGRSGGHVDLGRPGRRLGAWRGDAGVSLPARGVVCAALWRSARLHPGAGLLRPPGGLLRPRVGRLLSREGPAAGAVVPCRGMSRGHGAAGVPPLLRGRATRPVLRAEKPASPASEVGPLLPILFL